MELKDVLRLLAKAKENKNLFNKFEVMVIQYSLGRYPVRQDFYMQLFTNNHTVK